MRTRDFSTIRRIRRLAQARRNDSDDDLKRQGLTLKYEATVGRNLSKILPAAFALAIESARRSIGLTPYDVQILGAIEIANGNLAEMKTGEGKTLTATMPVYLHALAGRGVHVATVNDYLANRDFETMAPVYHRLGLTTGVVQADYLPQQRKQSYGKDVTYGTAKEFGFDFLRDRLERLRSRDAGEPEQTQRELNFALVDEADSVLIDEARTPLIIGTVDAGEALAEQGCYRWAAQHAPRFQEGTEYRYDHDRKSIDLLDAGLLKIRQLPEADGTRTMTLRQLNKFIENAIKVRRDFEVDKNYVVREGKIAIVDEFTGRVAEGRQWQEGIHQSVESKENLEITPVTRHGATVTLQSFFGRYRHFAGMTGTAWSSRRELKKVYRQTVVRIPTHRPVRREKLPTQIFSDFESKVRAVAEEVRTMALQGRAVLIGTRSIETSEAISNRLHRQEIAHEVLNANNLAREAEIVAGCGQAGCVTVATNMAGRGTDIILSDAVRTAGGLHVILTELHESQRIDWQLIGRGSRQGDPGSFRIFVALDDELLRRGLPPKEAARLLAKYSLTGNRAPDTRQELNASSRPNKLPRGLFRHFLKAQAKLERSHFVDRMILRRLDTEKHQRQFEMGLDPYCEVVS